MLMLIREMYGEPIDIDSSREHRSMSALFMEAHMKRLSELVDRLAEHNADSIDAMTLSLFRGEGSAKERARNATTIYAWHGLLTPWRADQKPYLDTARLLKAMRTDAEAMHTYAVYIIGGLDPALWNEIRLLSPKLAADFFKYSLMFAYQNLSNEEVTQYVKLEPDPDNFNRANHVAPSWGDFTDEGK